MKLRGALIIGLVALTLATPAGAAEQASLPDIEDEVMCPVCGTLLELSESPQAERERVFIRRLIEEGRTKDEIKDALVAEYGRGVLATPDDEGFALTAWVVPPLALLAAGIGIAVVLVRRRRQPPAAPAPPLDPAESARLERELAERDY
jgi:cytochrome c-type biogenesis protein CcmH